MAASAGISAVLAAVKIAGGLAGRSQALLADGIESLLDVLSAAMMWGAIKYAERPPDRTHPYGHGKVESLAAFGGAAALIVAGLSIGFHSVQGLIRLSGNAGAGDVPAGFTLAIVAATIVIKEAVFRWQSRRGRAIGSRAVESDAWHHRSDALSSLAALAGITAALVGGPAWAQADDWAALFSSGLIVFNGLHMLRGALGDILDEQASGEVVRNITTLAAAVPGVLSVEKCRVRKSGLVRLADLHVRVDGSRTVYEGHEIAHQVTDRLLAAGLQLADVTVHIEPEGG